MAAYVIVEVTIHDPELMQEYRKYTLATITAFDGKFIVRGGQTTTLEGDWRPERIVVLEFPTVERANAWWHSEIYAEPKRMRQAAGTTRMIIVEGLCRSGG
jgi:uncharacterized protein (DUF1330 family)